MRIYIVETAIRKMLTNVKSLRVVHVRGDCQTHFTASTNFFFVHTHASCRFCPIPILWPRDFQGKSLIRFRSHGVALRHNFLVAYTKLVIGNVSNPPLRKYRRGVQTTASQIERHLSPYDA